MTKIEIVYTESSRIPKSNFVKSPHVFVQGRNARNKKNRDLDLDGLYSPKIFGRFGVCQCGITTKVNKVCSNCGYRVLSATKKSLFGYKTVCDVLRFSADISMIFTPAEIRGITDASHILDLASYQYAVLVTPSENRVLPAQEAIDQSEEEDEILFGEDAIKEILSSDEYEKWTDNRHKVLTDTVMISHPITRPYTITAAGKLILPDATEHLSRMILRDQQTAQNMRNMNEQINDRMINFLSYMAINAYVKAYYEAVYEVFASTKSSVRKSHVISTNSSAIGRYVLVNDPFLKPTEIAVPMSFVYANYRVNEEMTYEQINELLSTERVLLNRPPTVSNLSMMSLTPVIGYDSVVGINPAIATGFNADFDGDQVIILPMRTTDADAISYWEQRRELVTGGWRNGFLKRQIEFISSDKDIQSAIGIPEDIVATGQINEWFNELEQDEHLRVLSVVNANLHRAVGISLGDFKLDDAGKVHSESQLLKPGQDENLFNVEFDNDMVTDFRNGVITSKVGITESGYFYKKAVAAGEYYRFSDKFCDAPPTKVVVADEAEFNRRVRNHYGPDGVPDYTGPGEYEVYTVMNCEFTMKHTGKAYDRNNPVTRHVCKKCFGFIDSEGVSRSPYIGVNTGIMLSEVISQETLNAINKGDKDMSVLKILENKFTGTRAEVENFIEDSYQKFVELTGIENFEDRWIQVQFLSTTYEVHYKRKKLAEPLFEVMTKISSMKMSDPLTHWIQTPQINMFKQLIGQPVVTNSLKSEIMLNKKS